MKYLVGTTGNGITKMAAASVNAEGRGTDAAAYNRADEFLSCSQQQADLRWIKLDVPSLPRFIREFADAVFEYDPAVGMLKTKDREVVLVTDADAVIVAQSDIPWYTRKFTYGTEA
jgi:hypothetical protein